MKLEEKVERSLTGRIWDNLKINVAKGLFYGAMTLTGCGGGGGESVVTGPVVTDEQGEAQVEDSYSNPFDVIVRDEKNFVLLPDKTVYVIHHSEEVYVFDSLKNYVAEFKIIASNPVNLEVLLSNVNDRIMDSLPEYKTWFHYDNIDWTLGTTKIASNVPLSQLADFYENNESKSFVSILEVVVGEWQIASFAGQLNEVRDLVIQNASDVAALIGLSPDRIFYDIYRENISGLLYHKKILNPGKIVFSSKRDGNWEIYRMKPDGSDLMRLTNHPSDDCDPALSPDGTKVIFVSKRGGDWEIYKMNVNGSGVVSLANNIDYTPAWSPDGNEIVFASYRDGNNEIYKMNSDGTNQVNLTNISDGDLYPDWSPDGSKIVFASSRGGVPGIYTMNTDGSNVINLSNNNDSYPSWSPDGTEIAFVSSRDGDYELYKMNSDGTNQVNLTNSPFYLDCFPRWSLDGTKMIYVSDKNGYFDIFMIDPDGTNEINLTNIPDTSDSEPFWSR